MEKVTFENVLDNELIYDGDDLIGFKGALVKRFKFELAYMASGDSITAVRYSIDDTLDALSDLEEFESDVLLKVSYNPMGAWVITKFKEVK